MFTLLLLCAGSRVAERFCSAGSCVYCFVAETLLCRKLFISVLLNVCCAEFFVYSCVDKTLVCRKLCLLLCC